MFVVIFFLHYHAEVQAICSAVSSLTLSSQKKQMYNWILAGSRSKMYGKQDKVKSYDNM